MEPLSSLGGAVPRSGARTGPVAAVSARRLGVTVAGAAAAFTAILVALLMPWGARMIDLDVYRAAASGVMSGADPYSVSGPDGLPFTYPLFAALVFIPFALAPTLLARAAITLMSFTALLFICHVSLREALPGRSGRQLSLVSVPVAVLAVSAHPVLDTLLFGQVNLILVAMVLADVFIVTGRARGVLVGLATGIKLVPGLFLVYYLVTGQRREARTAAVTAGLTVLAGFAARPAAAWDFWTRYALDPARAGNVTYAGNQSILAMTARLLREPHPPPPLTWAISAAVVISALLVARRLRASGEELTAVSAVAAAGLLASPISWTHHWVWFIPAGVACAAWAYRAGGRWRWWVLGLALIVLWSGPMRFTPKNNLRELAHTPPQQLVANSFGLLAVAFLLWASLRRGTEAGRRGGAGARARAGAGGSGRARGGEDVDHEPQGAGGGAAGLVRVGEGGRDVDLQAAADRTADEGLVPALDDVPGADLRREGGGGGVVPARVELLAGGVVHPDIVD